MSTATKKKKNQIIGTNEEKERDNMVFFKDTASWPNFNLLFCFCCGAVFFFALIVLESDI